MLSFKMALHSIGSNKLRAVLTMLGIIIGVMALVVLVSLVNGATNSVTDAVSGLGSNMLTVTVSDDKGNPLDLETVNSWMEREDIGLVAPYLTDSVTMGADGNSSNVVAYGTTPALYEIQGMQLAMGRFLKTSDVENHTCVCVINETAAEELIGYVDCVEQAITLNGVEYTIVGVLSENTGNLTSMLTSGSMSVYLPYTTLIRLSDSLVGDVTKFCVSAPESGTMDQVEEAATRLLVERFGNDEEAFTVSAQNVLEDTLGYRYRAYPGDRHPQGHRCQSRQYPHPVSDGSGGAVYDRLLPGNFPELGNFADGHHRGFQPGHDVYIGWRRSADRSGILLCDRCGIRPVSGE